MDDFKELFSEKAIILNLKATNKEQALKEIAKFLHDNNYIDSASVFYQALIDREKQFSTGIGQGIGIPHAQNKSVLKDVVLIARHAKGIPWEASDKQLVKTIFTIALNDQNAANQTTILANLAKLMLDQSRIELIKKAKNKAEILQALFNEKNQQQEIKPQIANLKSDQNIVAVTACPTGIAHTFLAKEALVKASKDLEVSIKVETQGRKIDNLLSIQDIEKADAIILAVDKKIEHLERFGGKKVLKVSTKQAISNSLSVVKQALNGEGQVIPKSDKQNEIASDDLSWANFKNVYQNLMGGVSKMLPFVIAGGILLGLAFLLDSGITTGNLGVTRDISRWFAGLGKVTFGIFVPVLGAYVAYAIVGQEGLLPGFVAGLIASGGGLLYGGNPEGWANLWGGLTPGIDQDVLAAGSGFIGAMVGGYLAAASVLILRKYIFVKVNETFRGIVAIIAVPVLSVLFTGAGMFVLQIPLAYLAYGLKVGLKGLQDHNLLPLLGIIIGLMMAADMGGPINKAAYVFATGLLENGDSASYQIMGAVMIAGMVPPLVIAFSTLVFRRSAWSETEQQSSYANWLMGAFFITEGAIPFAATDPKRVIPSIMIASAIAGGIMTALQVGISAPHGGIFVFALLRSYLFTNSALQIALGIVFALGAIAAGTIIGGLTLGFWRKSAIKAGKLTLR